MCYLSGEYGRFILKLLAMAAFGFVVLRILKLIEVQAWTT